MSTSSMRSGAINSTEELQNGRQVIQDALALLERPNGWCKEVWWKTTSGSFFVGNREFAYSIDGALRQVAIDFRALFEAYRILGKSEHWVTAFNDDPETTHERVTAFLREKIA